MTEKEKTHGPVRLGGNPFRKEHDAVHYDGKTFTVGLFFRRPENTSDFRVDVSWADVENLIIEFATARDPKASHLQEAKRLADAAREAGWLPRSR